MTLPCHIRTIQKLPSIESPLSIRKAMATTSTHTARRGAQRRTSRQMAHTASAVNTGVATR